MYVIICEFACYDRWSYKFLAHSLFNIFLANLSSSPNLGLYKTNTHENFAYTACSAPRTICNSPHSSKASSPFYSRIINCFTMILNF